MTTRCGLALHSLRAVTPRALQESVRALRQRDDDAPAATGDPDEDSGDDSLAGSTPSTIRRARSGLRRGSAAAAEEAPSEPDVEAARALRDRLVTQVGVVDIVT